MKAGRELDALIAEKVMGWRFVNIGGPAFIWVPPYAHPQVNALGLAPPKFSEDIGAAWKVVEKIRKPGQSWNFQIFSDGTCEAEFYEPVRAETMPHAICLAALKALEDK